ncbi:MAG: RluA family pseudouridine synthase [Clostridiales bacterium]|nr:RluA family pseudouridine synthase [Clostridiales bacterium]
MNREKNVPIPILYEDNHLLVVEKPVNIPTQADASGDLDLLTILKQDLKIRYQKPGNVYLGLVHRLDRPVGGVMVFAKTSKAASRLSEQVRNHSFVKIYYAVLHGIPNPSKGRLEHYLAKDRSKNIVRVTEPTDKEGRHAILEFFILEEIKNKTPLSLAEVQLFTGRSHQIRVQFSAIGHPLFGDQKYGKGINQPGQQIALWSHEIRLMHPTKKEELVFISNPPDQYPWNLFSSIEF